MISAGVEHEVTTDQVFCGNMEGNGSVFLQRVRPVDLKTQKHIAWRIARAASRFAFVSSITSRIQPDRGLSAP